LNKQLAINLHSLSLASQTPLEDFMAISSVSAASTAPIQQAPAKADGADNSSTTAKGASSQSSAPAGQTAAPTVLTPGGVGTHHHKKHHILPGQPGQVVNKRA